MTIEQVELDEPIEIKGTMRQIDPEYHYTKRNFTGFMEHFSLLEQIAQEVKTPEGNWKDDLRQKASILLTPNPKFYTGTTPDIVASEVGEEYEKYSNQVKDYTFSNFNKLLEKVSGKSLIQSLSSLPLAKTGKKNLDRVIGLINENKKIAEATKNGRVEAYVMEKLSKGSKSRYESFRNYSAGSTNHVEKTFKVYAEAVQNELNKILLDEQKNINAPLLRRVFKESYKKFVAEDTKDMDKVAGMYLLDIAHGAYQAIKSANRGKKR